MKTYFIFWFMLGTCWCKHVREKNNYYKPEQVHISFGDKPNTIVATWSTFNETDSIVRYGIKNFNQNVSGTSKIFIDGGKMKRPQWIHRAAMKNLKFDTHYVYKVGSYHHWSENFSFKTPPAGEDWVVRIAIYGDMGLNGSKALPFLKNDVAQNKYDMIIHVGDFAYDMNEQEGRVGDDFMNMIQPIAARVPYMTCPGNHEQAYNFSHYSSRFTMPGPDSNLFYSFNLGPVHFISISTEVYYFTQYGLKLIANQFEWLKEDLAVANKPANRKRHPWIILYGHRPMYCSNSDDYDCSVEYTRTGFLGLFPLEPLLQEFGVDVAVWAHEHSYERTWPLYDQRVYNGSYQQPYHNPRAPVHIVTGSAGCREGTDPFVKKVNPWSAYRSSSYGYTKFWAHNHTHLHLEQVVVEHVPKNKEGDIVDSFWIVKDKHQPYSF